MKIALIAPPWSKLPSQEYTGIESTISEICDKLVEYGEEVILFAPEGSSSSNAEIVYYPENTAEIDWAKADRKLRLYFKNIIARYASMYSLASGVDIIHNFSLAGELDLPVPALYTVYGPSSYDTVTICEKISEYPNNYLIAISNKQRTDFTEASPNVRFIDTVYKTINPDNIPWEKEKEDYFLFIGQSEQVSGLELAKRVTDANHVRLVAVIQGEQQKLFNNEIEPWLEKKTVNLNLQLSEELLPDARYDLYKKAKATFYISKWEEPFGMEMLESLACGTPVIALRKGAAPEVIENKRTGFLVETESEMIEAVKNIDKIKPEDCRNSAREKFSSDIITKKYLNIYKKVLKEKNQ